jgi:hypothetical protein
VILPTLKRAREWFWSIDALLFVMMYTAVLLLIPTPSPKWRQAAGRK